MKEGVTHPDEFFVDLWALWCHHAIDYVEVSVVRLTERSDVLLQSGL